MYQNKVVVITGGSSGIGAHLAEAYLRQKAEVIVFDIIESDNPHVHFYAVDLGKPQQIEKAFSAVVSQFGTVHILINNGAITSFSKPVEEISVEEFARVIDVNLIGAFACSKAMIKANHGQIYGRIINIASTRWNQNEPGWDAYGSSKGGLLSLTQSLTVSLSQTPITVNAVSPGWIQVDNYDSLTESDHRQHPSGRVGNVEDIANACLFFTAPENDFVNGANLVVDGGMARKMIYQDSMLD